MLFYLDNARSMADSTQPTLQGRQQAQRIRRVPLGRGSIFGGMPMPRPQQQQQQRQRQGLNENYGRELLELHTLGVDGGYTQQDVINVARAFTGWTIKPPAQGGGFIFRPQVHDAGEKVVLGHRLAAGRGEEDAEEVLDILAKSPATAHFISFKLARRFVSAPRRRSSITRRGFISRLMGASRDHVAGFFSQQAFHSR
jgi:hypothetical protein